MTCVPVKYVDGPEDGLVQQMPRLQNRWLTPDLDCTDEIRVLAYEMEKGEDGEPLVDRDGNYLYRFAGSIKP